MSLDLAVLVPDKDIEQALRGILGRAASLKVRPVKHKIVTHPGRDPGCYKTPESLLGPLLREAQRGLVVFDRAWHGAPSEDPKVLEEDVEGRLRRDFGDRARCVVIDPEVEVWLFSDSPKVAEVFGWAGRSPSLRNWLEERGLWRAEQLKPADPKQAFEAAVREVGVKPSAALFLDLAQKVSLERCGDRSFRRLIEILQRWFGLTVP